MPTPLFLYFIIISFLFSLLVYSKRSSSFYLKLFPPFLLITVLIEYLGVYLVNKGKETFLLYNFFTGFEFCFYLFILSYIVKKAKAGRIILYTLFSYFFVTLINILFIQTNGFHSITYSLGCLLIVVFCIYYFYELFRRSTSITLTKEPAFWICSALLFYYCCSFPLFGAANLLYNLPRILLYNMQNIVNVMNILLYSLFTIAFLCRIRIPKYTLQ